MKLIVGLGNPGEKYKDTRHNYGFRIVDRLAAISNVKFTKEKKFESEVAEISLNDNKVLLSKPQTFMNNSGQAVQRILNFYKLDASDLWVIYDDKDLDLGTLRVRNSGSSGGHKGVQSIIDHLGTESFTRFRLGIMNEQGNQVPTEAFVLQNFSSEEEAIVTEVINTTAGEIEKALEKGIEPVSK